MGIMIAGVGEDIPRAIVMELECDNCPEDDCRFDVFQHVDGYFGMHPMAMKAGWLERNGSNGRLWLCPECSGKK